MRCYVCDREEWGVRNGALRDAPHVGVQECSHCGVVVAAEPHGIAIDYEAGSMRGREAVVHQVPDQLALLDNKRRFNQTSSYLRPGGSFLEIGPGSGDFLALAKRRGFSGIGVELDSGARSECHNRQLDVRRDLYDFSVNQRSQVNVCMMFHVLEHLPNPREFLNTLVNDLPNLERIFIEVPCADDPLLVLYENEDFQRFTYWSHHEHLHTTMSLALVAFAVSSDLRIERVQRYGLANHMGWFMDGKPGGHLRYIERFTENADSRYRQALLKSGYSDTLWCEVRIARDVELNFSSRTLCFDIDGTLCSNTNGKYEDAEPLFDRIDHVNRLFGAGNRIVLHTARGSSTGIDWSGRTRKQLAEWGVKYHEVLFNKPFADLHVDDKAVNAQDYDW